MSRINLKDLLLSGFSIGIAAFMVIELSGMRSAVAGTIGPGVYPAITLGLVIISGLFIIVKALKPVRLRLILPFSPGGLKGLMFAALPGILARGFGDRVQLKPAAGNGFFSARHLASKAEPDGDTFAVITGEQPSPSCFFNAGLNLREYEPAVLLTFDPYVFVAKANDNKAPGEESARGTLSGLLSSGTVGFSFQEQVAEPLRRALAHRTGEKFEIAVPASTKLMLRELESGGMSIGLCPLSDLTGDEGLGKTCRLVAVGSPERLPDHPETPTLQELGLDIVWGVWMGLALPAGTPKSITQKVWELVSDGETMPLLRDDIRHNGGVDSIRGGDDFRKLLQDMNRVGLETAANGDAEQYTKSGSLPKVCASVALLVAFIALAPLVGFLASSLVFLTALTIVLWPANRIKALPLLLAVSVGASLGVYWIFSQAFSVVFP